MNPLLAEMIKYCISGVCATVVDLSLFFIITHYLLWHYQLAVVIAWTGGTYINFLVCLLIFKRQHISVSKAWIRHFQASLAGLIINMTVMYILVDVIGLPNLLICKVIATGSSFICNFLLIRFYAFNGHIQLRKLLFKQRNE